MGLKFIISTLSKSSIARLKSDQNGIEIGLPGVFVDEIVLVKIRPKWD